MRAKRWGGDSTLYFRNLDNSRLPDEFGYPSLTERGEMFVASMPYEDLAFPLPQNVHPVAGFCGGNYAISPVRDQYFSEFALHYVGLFLLSSLVRYRPQTWMHAISRSTLPDTPADDQSLSLLETFLAINTKVIPKMVVRVLNPREDCYLEPQGNDI